MLLLPRKVQQSSKKIKPCTNLKWQYRFLRLRRTILCRIDLNNNNSMNLGLRSSISILKLMKNWIKTKSKMKKITQNSLYSRVMMTSIVAQCFKEQSKALKIQSTIHVLWMSFLGKKVASTWCKQVMIATLYRTRNMPTLEKL